MPRTTTFAAVVVLALAVGAGALLAVGSPPGPDAGDHGDDATPAFETFDSESDLAQYIRRARRTTGGARVLWTGRVLVAGNAAAEGDAVALSSARGYALKSGPRHSETNTQEAAVGEPDVVKTDGEQIYYSPDPTPYYGEWAGTGTKVVDVRPPGTAEKLTQLPATGKLLLVNDTLVVVGNHALYGYDVSDPADPDRLWSRSLNASVVTGRLLDGTVYLVLATPLSTGDPCPVEPLGGESVRCTDVYHPREPVPIDVTYTALTLDPATGDVTDRLSFVGSANNVVYMSTDGLYVTYTDPASRGQVALDFLLSEGQPLLGDRSVDRLQRLRSYNLSDRAVYAEIQAVLDAETAGMSPDARDRFYERLGDAYREYAREHRHQFASTRIVKLDVGGGDGLSVAATGSVPGHPLDQFSLDERNGSLRVATTVQPPRLWGDVNATNDVYVLDQNLSVAGKVTGMGENERIYSVRFHGDRGYVVTYRRIDPFHVLDLSNPQNPTLEGTLKLPGFSTYLHPLGDGRVLGIGEQDGTVKAVIFNASDPTDPRVADSVVLPDEWSAIRQSHHAFLLDPRHQVFFLPGSRGGHVYSYDDGLQEVYTVEITDPRRAVYVGNYLYVFGADEVVVVNEKTWTEVERQDL